MIIDIVMELMSKSKTKTEDEQRGGGISSTIWYTISLLTYVGAIALSWNCNDASGSSVGMKVMYAFLAGFFSHFYLMFYVIYRVLLGNAC